MSHWVVFILGVTLGFLVSLYLKDSLNIDIKFDRDGVKTKKIKFKENIGENDQD